MEGERIWKGTCVVEHVHVLARPDGKAEVVIVTAGGAGDLAQWLRKSAALMDRENRRLEDPDGD